MPNVSLSVVIIAYNEENCLARVAEDTLKVLEEHFPLYELIIVNDGSRDGTAAIADSIAQKNKNVTALHHQQNKGIDEALKTGYARAKCDYVTFLPADGQIPPQELLKFLPQVRQHDMVLSSYSHRPDSGKRLFMSRTMRKMIKWAIGFDMRNEGVYVVKREMLQSIKLESHSVLVHFELPMKVVRRGGSIGEVVIDCHKRLAGESKVANLSTISKTFWNLLKLRWILRHYRQ